MDLDRILNDVQTNIKSRNDCFERVYDAGYYSGMPKLEARRRFDLELARDDARRLQLLSAYQPYTAGRNRKRVKLNKSLAALAVGAVLLFGSTSLESDRAKSNLRLAGLTAIITAGSLASYYALRGKK